MRIAITREVSPSIGRCELTHRAREPINVEVARAQHARYEACLAALGCTIQRLPAELELPDAVFVEDTAVVLDELVVMTRPGAESRRPEVVAVAEALRPYRRLFAIEPPGTLDGGDVLRVGKTVFVGASSRSNPAGIAQLRAVLELFGYTVASVVVCGCLHLKSAATPVAEKTLLVNRAWVDAGAFGGLGVIHVDPAEPFGANALLVGETVVYPAAHPRTRRRLEDRGIPVQVVDVSELAKAEGAVTCCSLIFDFPSGNGHD